MPTEITQSPSVPSFSAALEARRAVLEAMPETMINRRIRLDVIDASESTTRALRNLDEELRAMLVAEYGERASKILDGLETTARAARQAEAALGTKEETADVAAIHAEVMAMYERLFTDASSLALRGFLPKERLAAPRELKSYQGTLQSLLWVIEVFRDVWPSVEGETPVKLADLAAADALAARMADAMAKKSLGALRASAVETRTRAMSLLIREYEELRRMVTFVRWFEGDYDRLVPSLYAGRGGRGKKDEPANDEDLPVSGPVPNNGGPAFTS